MKLQYVKKLKLFLGSKSGKITFQLILINTKKQIKIRWR